MKVYADEVNEGDEVSFTYLVWRGFEEWTPVKTGYREVITIEDAGNSLLRFTFRDTSTRVFNVSEQLELKQDWDKVEYYNSYNSENESPILGPSSNP